MVHLMEKKRSKEAKEGLLKLLIMSMIVILNHSSTNPNKQSTYETGRALNSKKPMLQSTLDGGIGSSHTSMNVAIKLL